MSLRQAHLADLRHVHIDMIGVDNQEVGEGQPSSFRMQTGSLPRNGISTSEYVFVSREGRAVRIRKNRLYHRLPTC